MGHATKAMVLEFLCFITRVLLSAVSVVVRQAIAALEQAVDTLIVVNNDQLLKIIPSDTPVEHAFKVADDVLRQVGVVFVDDGRLVGPSVGGSVGRSIVTFALAVACIYNCCVGTRQCVMLFVVVENGCEVTSLCVARYCGVRRSIVHGHGVRC